MTGTGRWLAHALVALAAGACSGQSTTEPDETTFDFDVPYLRSEWEEAKRWHAAWMQPREFDQLDSIVKGLISAFDRLGCRLILRADGTFQYAGPFENDDGEVTFRRLGGLWVHTEGNFLQLLFDGSDLPPIGVPLPNS